MESLGDKLRAARERKKVSFDQASRDTKISARYLEALEKENFSAFPGEAYVIGFLKNYGVYLELDVQEVLSLYRMLLAQEQPIPVEQLLKKPSPVPGILLKSAVALVILGAIVGVVFLVINRPESPSAPVPVSRAAVEHTMGDSSFERRFFVGDSLLVPFGEDVVRAELFHLAQEVTLRVGGRDMVVDLGQIIDVDIGGGLTGLRVSAVDFDRNNADNGVHLRFELVVLSDYFLWEGPLEVTPDANAVSPSVIFSSPNPHPFTLQTFFQGNCMFRWEVLAERDRPGQHERFFQQAEELTIQAQNGIRIWSSNAQAARFQVIGGGRTFPVEIGGPGEVVVADIRWIRDEYNRFHLVFIRLET